MASMSPPTAQGKPAKPENNLLRQMFIKTLTYKRWCNEQQELKYKTPTMTENRPLRRKKYPNQNRYQQETPKSMPKTSHQNVLAVDQKLVAYNSVIGKTLLL